MAQKTLTEKAVDLFEHYAVEAQKEAFIAIKELVTKNVLKRASILQEEAEQEQEFIQKINPNSY